MRKKWQNTLGEEEKENDRQQGREYECDCGSTEQEPGCSLEIMMAPVPDLIYFWSRCHIPFLSTFHWFPLYLLISDRLIALSLHQAFSLLPRIARPLFIRFFFSFITVLHPSLSLLSHRSLASSLINHCVPRTQPQRNANFILMKSCWILVWIPAKSHVMFINSGQQCTSDSICRCTLRAEDKDRLGH